MVDANLSKTAGPLIVCLLSCIYSPCFLSTDIVYNNVHSSTFPTTTLCRPWGGQVWQWRCLPVWRSWPQSWFPGYTASDDPCWGSPLLGQGTPGCMTLMSHPPCTGITHKGFVDIQNALEYACTCWHTHTHAHTHGDTPTPTHTDTHTLEHWWNSVTLMALGYH